jgi:hypothetical protein
MGAGVEDDFFGAAVVAFVGRGVGGALVTGVAVVDAFVGATVGNTVVGVSVRSRVNGAEVVLGGAAVVFGAAVEGTRVGVGVVGNGVGGASVTTVNSHT